MPEEGNAKAHGFGFAPVARPDARVLILGTLPGAESLRKQEYYAKSQNVFWKIVGELFGAGPEMPYPQRLQMLERSGVALWDVCASAWREGSLDANIQEITPNNFDRFLLGHPDIQLIAFNGRRAETLFERFVLPDLTGEARKITRKSLPSTSPAHAAMPFARKLSLWSDVLKPRA